MPHTRRRTACDRDDLSFRRTKNANLGKEGNALAIRHLRLRRTATRTSPLGRGNIAYRDRDLQATRRHYRPRTTTCDLGGASTVEEGSTSRAPGGNRASRASHLRHHTTTASYSLNYDAEAYARLAGSTRAPRCCCCRRACLSTHDSAAA